MYSVAARRALVFVGLAMVCLISGCEERLDQGDAAVFHFAWKNGFLTIVGGILAMSVGWCSWSVSCRLGIFQGMGRKFGLLLMMAGFVASSLIGPSRFTDRVVIDDTHFETTYGFWLRPSHQSVRFDEIDAMRVESVTNAKGRRSVQLQCRRKDGGLVSIPLGELFRPTLPEVMARARARGVAVGPEANLRKRSGKPVEPAARARGRSTSGHDHDGS